MHVFQFVENFCYLSVSFCFDPPPSYSAHLRTGDDWNERKKVKINWELVKMIVWLFWPLIVYFDNSWFILTLLCLSWPFSIYFLTFLCLSWPFSFYFDFSLFLLTLLCLFRPFCLFWPFSVNLTLLISESDPREKRISTFLS